MAKITLDLSDTDCAAIYRALLNSAADGARCLKAAEANVAAGPLPADLKARMNEQIARLNELAEMFEWDTSP